MLKVRSAKKDDDVTDLILSAGACVFHEYKVDDIKACCQYLFESENNKFSYENSLVLEKNNQIVGVFIIYAQNVEDQLALGQENLLKDKYQRAIDVVKSESVVNSYYLDTLAVNSNYQGQGMGKFLLNYIQEHYKNVSLLVDLENPKAYKLYQELGFKKVGLLNVFEGEFYQMHYTRN